MRSPDDIYCIRMTAPNEEKENSYRCELMKPFACNRQCVGIPLKAETAEGYDVVLAAGIGGDDTSPQITNERHAKIGQNSNNIFEDTCGYAFIAHYLKKTRQSIYKGTITPAMDILKETEDFGN